MNDQTPAPELATTTVTNLASVTFIDPVNWSRIAMILALVIGLVIFLLTFVSALRHRYDLGKQIKLQRALRIDAFAILTIGIADLLLSIARTLHAMSLHTPGPAERAMSTLNIAQDLRIFTIPLIVSALIGMCSIAMPLKSRKTGTGQSPT